MKQIIYFLLIVLLSNCSSAHLESEWQQPETVNFQANKLLVIGISTNSEVRRNFETKMVDAFKKQDVIAVRSIDFFEDEFSNAEKTEDELTKIEKKLMDDGFDAVIFSKVTGQEKRVSILKKYNNQVHNIQTFRDYYYSNQHIYAKEDNLEYTIYNTETSAYCLCPGKPRELLWVGEIKLVNVKNLSKSLHHYVKLLVTQLKEKRLIIIP